MSSTTIKIMADVHLNNEVQIRRLASQIIELAGGDPLTATAVHVQADGSVVLDAMNLDAPGDDE